MHLLGYYRFVCHFMKPTIQCRTPPDESAFFMALHVTMNVYAKSRKTMARPHSADLDVIIGKALLLWTRTSDFLHNYGRYTRA